MGEHDFRNYHFHLIYKYLVLNFSFFLFVFYWIYHFFWKSQNLFLPHKIEKRRNSCAGARKMLNFRVSTYSVSSASRAELHDSARRAEFTVGIDGWDGWMVGVSKVSFNFLHTFWVYRKSIYLLIYIYLYINIYIYTQKLWPTFLWVSNFHVKLGVVVKNFKITAGRWFFFFWI